MNKFRLVASFLILGFMLVAVPAMAAQVKLLSSSPYSYSPGGEFTWQVSSDLSWILNGYSTQDSTKTRDVLATSPGNFQSFCLEKSEFINWGSTYNVAFSNAAISGGVGATNGADPISKGTAWLYSQFAAGSLAGYDYTNPGRSDGTSSSAALLQNAIWFLENEISTNQTGNMFYDAAVRTLTADHVATHAASGEYGVKVMNLTDAAGGQHQDQLVMVPEPSTLILLGICLVGVAIGVKKFNLHA